MLLLLIVNVVNFGGLFYSAITVANAARNGSQYLALGGATIGAPGHTSASLIHDLIVADSVTLLNPANVSVRACKENKVTPSASLCTTFGGAAFTTNPTLDARSEAVFFAMAWVDVQYDYEPYIPLFTVPVLGVPLTTPPTTLRSQSVMRMLQ
jgi:hypothetical protein